MERISRVLHEIAFQVYRLLWALLDPISLAGLVLLAGDVYLLVYKADEGGEKLVLAFFAGYLFRGFDEHFRFMLKKGPRRWKR